MKPVNLYFLHHSGFMVELEKVILVFDYYLDPAGHVEKSCRRRIRRSISLFPMCMGIISIRLSGNLKTGCPVISFTGTAGWSSRMTVFSI